MPTELARTLSLLRQEKGLSQRAAAASLGVSQALLSHYEKGAREPGLPFVCRACDFYGVSADFLLGRTMLRDGSSISAEELPDASEEKDNRLRGSVTALLHKKLLINAVSLVMELCGRTGRQGVINAAAAYLGTAVYQAFRRLYESQGNDNFFSTPAAFCFSAADADMHRQSARLTAALMDKKGKDPALPALSNEALLREFPLLGQSVMTVLHQAGQRMDETVNN